MLSGRAFKDIADQSAAIGLDLEVRCRKCPQCLRARAAMWRMRATQETTFSARTWFGTLTLSPESYSKALSIVQAVEVLNGIDYDLLDASEQFSLIVGQIGRDITKYIKRLRKQSGATLRYLLVVEKHQSGLPHFHMLVHEPNIDQSIGERELRKQWTFGFSKWKLADQKHPGYVCKYISKSAESRVRASLHYGTTPCGVTLSSEIAFNRKREIRPPKNHCFIGTDPRKDEDGSTIEATGNPSIGPTGTGALQSVPDGIACER